MPVMTPTQISLGLEASDFITSSDNTLTSGIGVHGAYVELFASTSIKGNWLNVVLTDPEAKTDYDVDIGIGAAGSETDLIPDIHYHVNLTGNSQISHSYFFKINIPVGTRISARTINAAAVDIDIDIILCGH